MNTVRFKYMISLIDQANARDTVWEIWQGQAQPRTYLYGLRMTRWLLKLYPEAPETAFIAARAQHICRWLVPRESYSRGRRGYLEWRTRLYRFHAEKTKQLMSLAGYGEQAKALVHRILLKRGLKREPQVQWVEDAACLVFLEYYFAPFIHEYPDPKIVDIVRKTWAKMSDRARDEALKLSFGQRESGLIQQALRGQ